MPGTPRQYSPKEEITVGLVNSLVLEMERSGMNLRYRIGATLTYSDRYLCEGGRETGRS